MSRNERKYCFIVLHVLLGLLCFGGISLMRTLCDAYYEEDESH